MNRVILRKNQRKPGLMAEIYCPESKHMVPVFPDRDQKTELHPGLARLETVKWSKDNRYGFFTATMLPPTQAPTVKQVAAWLKSWCGNYWKPYYLRTNVYWLSRQCGLETSTWVYVEDCASGVTKTLVLGAISGDEWENIEVQVPGEGACIMSVSSKDPMLSIIHYYAPVKRAVELFIENGLYPEFDASQSEKEDPEVIADTIRNQARYNPVWPAYYGADTYYRLKLPGGRFVSAVGTATGKYWSVLDSDDSDLVCELLNRGMPTEAVTQAPFVECIWNLLWGTTRPIQFRSIINSFEMPEMIADSNKYDPLMKRLMEYNLGGYWACGPLTFVHIKTESDRDSVLLAALFTRDELDALVEQANAYNDNTKKMIRSLGKKNRATISNGKVRFLASTAEARTRRAISCAELRRRG